MHGPRKIRRLFCAGLVSVLVLVSGCTLGQKVSDPTSQAPTAPVSTTAPAASAGSESSTLDTILKRGKVIVGLGLGNPPWGTYDKDNKPVGFDVELAQAIAKGLGVEIEIVPTESNNRIPFLLTGKVDLVLATFAATPERAKSVAFTTPYAPFKVSLLGKKSDTGIHTYRDLAGKTVAVVRGSTQDTLLTELAPKDTKITRYEDDPSSRLAFQQGKTDFLAGGEVGLLQLIKSKPAEYELKGVIGQTFPTIGVRRFDQDWLNWLNVFLMNHGASGKLGLMYEKWFEVQMSSVLPNY